MTTFRALLLVEADLIGVTVRFHEFCEDAETPGFPGQIGGKYNPRTRTVTVSTRRNFSEDRSDEDVDEILAHELRHANGAAHAGDCERLGLRCGGFTNALGEPR